MQLFEMTGSDDDDRRASSNPYASLQYDSSGDNANGVDAISHGVAALTARLRGGGESDAADDGNAAHNGNAANDAPLKPKSEKRRSGWKGKNHLTQEQREHLYDWRVPEGGQEDGAVKAVPHGHGGRSGRGHNRSHGSYHSRDRLPPLEPVDTHIDIYFETKEHFDGEKVLFIEKVIENCRLSSFKAGSKFISDYFESVPDNFEAGRDRVENLYIPTDGLSKKSLKELLHHIRKSQLPLPEGFDADEVKPLPMPTDEAGMTPIRKAIDMYQAYLFLGMQYGQVAHQPRITDAIIRHFADEKYFCKSDVMMFWRKCKSDDVFTRKIMKLVAGCVLRCGEELENSLRQYLEWDPELVVYWIETIGPMRERMKERKQREQQEKEYYNNSKEFGQW